MKKLIVGVFTAAALVGVAAPASAQRMDLGVGFVNQNQSWNGCCARGFGIDFSYNITQTETNALAIVIDAQFVKFSDAFGFEETDKPIVGGLRVKFMRNKRVSAFVQGTAGVMPWSDNDGDSGTDLLVGGGGGVQVGITDRVAAKAQYDFWLDKFEDEWFRIHRFFIAAVFNFGPR